MKKIKYIILVLIASLVLLISISNTAKYYFTIALPVILVGLYEDIFPEPAYDHEAAAKEPRREFIYGNLRFSVPQVYLYGRSVNGVRFRDILADKCYRLLNGECRGEFFKLTIVHYPAEELQQKIKEREKIFQNECSPVVVFEPHMKNYGHRNHFLFQAGDMCHYGFEYHGNAALFTFRSGAFPPDTINDLVKVSKNFLDTYSKPINTSSSKGTE